MQLKLARHKIDPVHASDANVSVCPKTRDLREADVRQSSKRCCCWVSSYCQAPLGAAANNHILSEISCGDAYRGESTCKRAQRGRAL